MKIIPRILILAAIALSVSACSTFPGGGYSSYSTSSYYGNPYYGQPNRYESNGFYGVGSPFGYPSPFGYGVYGGVYGAGLATPYYGYHGYPAPVVIVHSRHRWRHYRRHHHHRHHSRPMPMPTPHANPMPHAAPTRPHHGITRPVHAAPHGRPGHRTGHVPFNRQTHVR